MRWYKKHNDQKKLGGGKKTKRKYIYHSQLHFLKNFAVNSKEENEAGSDDSNFEQEASILQQTKTVERKPIEINPPPVNIVSNKKRKEPEQTEPTLVKTEGSEPITSRHLLFFQGILPSINHFNDDQTIEFQMGVLQLIKDIKYARATNNAVEIKPHRK